MAESNKTNVIKIGQAFRVANFLFLFLATVVMTILHPIQVKVREVCTAYDTPAGCWERHGESGHYRAINFNGETVSLSHQDASSGIVFDPLSYGSLITPVAYAMTMDAGVDGLTQSYCTDSFFPGNQSLELAACLAENIPAVFEVANGGLLRKLWTLSGGVDVWFFVWLSTFLSASFALLMMPSVLAAENSKVAWDIDSFKLYTLAIWHFAGSSTMIIFYIADSSLNLHIPLNNIVVGLSLTIFTVLVQVYWLRTAQTVTGAGHPKLAASYVAVKNPSQPGALRSLMYMDRHNTQHGPAAEGGDSLSDVYTLDTEVFTHKHNQHELLEATFVETTLTIPLIVMAVFSICVPTAMDWVVQSMYLRLYLVFITPALAFKFIVVYSKHLQASAADNAAEMRSILIVVLFALVSLVFFFGIDFITPVHESIFYWDLDFQLTKQTLFVLTCVILAVLTLVMPCGLITLYLYSPWTGSLASHDEAQRMIWYVTQAMLFALRMMAVVYVSKPTLWYGYFDPKDVVLNYGSP